MPNTTKYPGGNELLNPKELLDRLGVGYGARVGDLGCGSMAYFAFQAGQMVGDRGQVYAVDIMREVLSNVVGRLQLSGITNVKTVWSNLEQYGAADIKDSSLDFTILINILFQTKERGIVVKEATRMLKPGGRLLIVEWKSIGVLFGPPQELRVSPGKVKELAQAAGLKLEQEFEAGPYHFGQIYSK